MKRKKDMTPEEYKIAIKKHLTKATTRENLIAYCYALSKQLLKRGVSEQVLVESVLAAGKKAFGDIK
jgi:hypothetical protein